MTSTNGPIVESEDPAPRPIRRRFSPEYKLRMVAEYDAAPNGEKGAILRRERLYHSHIIEWRAARDAGAMTTRILGPDHPHTLTTRANLAHWRGEAGDPTAAATATAELLDHMVQVVSKDHALIRLFQQNLTYWQNAAEADGQGKGDSGTRTT